MALRDRTNGSSLLTPLATIGLGAAAMYFLDPVSGRRRQSVVREKTKEVARDFEHDLEVSYRDVCDHLNGLYYEANRLLRPSGEQGPGVGRVENKVVPREGEEESLQPGRAPLRSASSWSPLTRMVVSTVGSSLLRRALRRRGPVGATLGLVGANLLRHSFGTAKDRQRPKSALEASRRKGVSGEEESPQQTSDPQRDTSVPNESRPY